MASAPNKAVFIVGGGPSVADFDLEILRNVDVIAVNSAWSYVPWAQILFFRDYRWWAKDRFNNGERVLAEYQGRILTVAKHCKHPRLEYYDYAANEAMLAGKTTIYGGDSGTCSICLAWRLGYKAIFLIGFDLKAAKDGRTHFHEGHPAKTVDTEWRRFAGPQATLAKTLERKGILLRRLTEPGLSEIPIISVDLVREMGYLPEKGDA